MSIFSKIISGELPAHVVAEDADFLAFLDISPLVMGHVLVIPKKETDYIFDMDALEYAAFWAFAARVSKGVKLAFPCKKVGVAVVGLEVPHAHIHLIPINKVDDMNFARQKLQPSNEELAEAAEKIREHL